MASVLRADRGGDHLALADRPHAHLLRPITHEHGDRKEHERACDEHQHDRGAPAIADGQLRHRGHEDELSRARRAGEEADDHAQVGPEPAMRDRRAEDPADRAGPDADGQTPHEIELPDLADEQEPYQATDDEEIACGEASYEELEDFILQPVGVLKFIDHDIRILRGEPGTNLGILQQRSGF